MIAATARSSTTQRHKECSIKTIDIFFSSSQEISRKPDDAQSIERPGAVGKFTSPPVKLPARLCLIVHWHYNFILGSGMKFS
jgi:hypothetical protein